MKCKICQTEAKLAKTLRVMGRYEAKYFLCPRCNFMFVDDPKWLNEAYQSPIKITDTGYVMRNLYLSRKTLILFYLLFGVKDTYLDFGGGYGMLTRLMRDYGLNFLNDDAYTKNFFAQGFEYDKQAIKALTSFECFEHFVEPIKEVETMFSIAANIFFSTVLFPGTEAPPDDWEYYGLNHGQHISFYSEKTLEYLAARYKVYLYTNGTNLHLFTPKKIPQWYFRFILGLTKIQADILIRKLLRSRTVSDQKILLDQGL